MFELVFKMRVLGHMGFSINSTNFYDYVVMYVRNQEIFFAEPNLDD